MPCARVVDEAEETGKSSFVFPLFVSVLPLLPCCTRPPLLRAPFRCVQIFNAETVPAVNAAIVEMISRGPSHPLFLWVLFLRFPAPLPATDGAPMSFR
jgi:hypothetical protein